MSPFEGVVVVASDAAPDGMVVLASERDLAEAGRLIAAGRPIPEDLSRRIGVVLGAFREETR